MNSKLNQILAGVIILLIAVFMLAQRSPVNIGSMLYLFVGVAFVLLYITKKKSWSLIIGAYLSWFGISSMLSKFIGYKIYFNINFAMLFIITAMIFFILYYQKGKRGLLLPASILLWFGIYSLLKDIPWLPFADTSASLFLVCFGLSFITAYILGRGAKWALCVGAILIFGGSLSLFNSFQSISLNLRGLLGLVLLVFGIVVLLQSIRKH